MPLTDFTGLHSSAYALMLDYHRVLGKTENNFSFCYVNVFEIFWKITFILISNLSFITSVVFISFKIYILFFNSWVKIKLIIPGMRFKKRREYSFGIHKMQLCDHDSLDISLKQYQVSWYLIIQELSYVSKVGLHILHF